MDKMLTWQKAHVCLKGEQLHEYITGNLDNNPRLNEENGISSKTVLNKTILNKFHSLFFTIWLEVDNSISCGNTQNK